MLVSIIDCNQLLFKTWHYFYFLLQFQPVATKKVEISEPEWKRGVALRKTSHTSASSTGKIAANNTIWYYSQDFLFCYFARAILWEFKSLMNKRLTLDGAWITANTLMFKLSKANLLQFCSQDHFQIYSILFMITLKSFHRLTCRLLLWKCGHGFTLNVDMLQRPL